MGYVQHRFSCYLVRGGIFSFKGPNKRVSFFPKDVHDSAHHRGTKFRRVDDGGYFLQAHPVSDGPTVVNFGEATKGQGNYTFAFLLGYRKLRILPIVIFPGAFI